MPSAHNKVEFVERRKDVRIIVNVAGRFSLADRRNARGQRRVFDCRAVNLSVHSITLTSSTEVKVGDRVIAEIDYLGRLDGTVLRPLGRGFVMTLLASEEDQDKLRSKIEWLERHKFFDAPDYRSGARFLPTNASTRLIFSTGEVETCEVLDLSVTGAAISAATLPRIGDVLAVGSVVARVVRHFDGGFAVCFIESQNEDRVEAMVVRP